MKLYNLALAFLFLSVLITIPMAIGSVWLALDGQWGYATLWGVVAVLGAYFVRFYWVRHKIHKAKNW